MAKKKGIYEVHVEVKTYTVIEVRADSFFEAVELGHALNEKDIAKGTINDYGSSLIGVFKVED